MSLLSKAALEGEAFIGHMHTEQTFCFDMKSKKLSKKTGRWSYNGAGASGKVSVKGEELGGTLEGDGVFGHVGMEYTVDHTSRIPKFSVKADANLAKLSAEAKAARWEMEHKVFSADATFLSASASAGVGGNTMLPAATVEAHTLDTSASLGGIELSAGNGPNVSVSSGVDNLKPDQDTIKEALKNPQETRAEIQSTMNSPLKVLHDLFRKVDAEESSLGKFSAKGVGSVARDSDRKVTFENDLGIDTYTNGKVLGEAIFKKTGWYRKQLLEKAEKQHEKNEERLQENDGRDGSFIRRSNQAIADRSSGYFDKLNSVIDQSVLQKQDVDRRLEKATPGTKKAERLAARSQKLGENISQYTQIRDKISEDKRKANANLERASNISEVESKSTDQIVAEAKKNVQDFQNAIRQKGIEASGEEAVKLCASKIELNQRNDEIGRKLDENNKDLQNIISKRETFGPNDPQIARLNDDEKRIRNENKAMRAEKGDCQKACLEMDKNFSPRESSENFDQRDRGLQAESIDNKNAQAAVDDDIAIYCNEHGIVKDINGNYPSDQGLQNLLDTKNALENEGIRIQSDIDQNKKDWAKSENLGKTSITVSEEDGKVVVKLDDTNYKAHGQRHNKNSRDNNSGNSNPQSQNEQNSQLQQPAEDNNNVQQLQNGQEYQQHQLSENNNNGQNSQSQQSSETGNDGCSQSVQSSQSQQPVWDRNVQRGQSEQGNQSSQPSEGNNNQQSSSERNSQSQQPVENHNVQQRQSVQSSQPQQLVENNSVWQNQSESGNQSRSISDENANQNASAIHDSERHFQPAQGQSSVQEPEGSAAMPTRAVGQNGTQEQGASAGMPTRAAGQNGTQEQGASSGMPTRAAGQNGTQEQGASAGMPTRAVGQNETQGQGASSGMPTRAVGQNETQEQGASAGMPTRAAGQSGSASSTSSGQSHSSGQSM